jgi:hypothetical protein
MARPAAAPAPEPVEAMPEAVPCCRPGIAVAAAMNMSGEDHPVAGADRHEAGDEFDVGAVRGDREAERGRAEGTGGEGCGQRAPQTEPRHELACVAEPATTTAVGMRKPAPVCKAS